MTFTFKPANSYTDRHGVFVALVGGTNSGKTYSALRLARGIAGPNGKIAVADTEAGRTLHLKNEFNFDVAMMDSPHRPHRYADLAKHAEQKGYGALVIDSFSAEWAGQGGVLSWADDEAARLAGDDEAKRERIKGSSWIRPKSAHKAMVYSFLERRMPIIFSIRGEETFIPPKEKAFKPICNKLFLFEVTVSFRLASEKKGIIDLSDPKSYKMEGSHRDIFKNGEQLSERHGELLAQWATGAPLPEAGRQQAQESQRQASGQGSLLGDESIDRGKLPDAFKNAGEFIRWSRSYFLADGGADVIQAEVWEAKYAGKLADLKSRDQTAWEEIADLLRTAKRSKAAEAA